MIKGLRGSSRALSGAVLAGVLASAMPAAATVATAVGTTSVFVSPTTTTVNPLGGTGGQVVVDVRYNAAVDTSGAGAGLSFDRTRLQLTGVARDPGIVTDGASYAGYPSSGTLATFLATANSTGVIPVIAWTFTDGTSSEPAAADHGIFTATFTVIAAGDSTLTLGIGLTGGLLDGRAATYGGSVAIDSVVNGTVRNALPAAKMTALSAWKATNALTIAWSGTAGSYPIQGYDVRYRKAAWNGSFGTYTAWLSSTALTSSPFTSAAGSTYCFSARAQDSQGNLSPWSAETCTAAPLDDRSLTRTSSWTAKTGSSFYKGTYVQASASGAKLTRSSAKAKRVALLATTCSTCGSVKVYYGTTLLKTVSLYSSTTVNKKLITVYTFSSVKSGTFTIKVSSSGKKVLIDGLVLSQR